MQGAWVQSLVRELDLTCTSIREIRRDLVQVSEA